MNNVEPKKDLETLWELININGFEAPPQPKKGPAQMLFIPILISAAVLPWSLGNLELKVFFKPAAIS